MRNPFDFISNRISKRGFSIGVWLTIANAEISEAVCLLGFDWGVIDLEHSPLDFSDAENLLIGLSCRDSIVGIVRVPINDPVYIKRALDIGAQGIIAPLINNREDTENLVKYSLYPPKGIRGVGPRRASRYGLIPLKKYIEYSEKIILIPQIETKEALDNLDNILDVEEIHGVFIGPSDLATNLGMERSFNNPEFEDVLRKIAEKARKRKSIIGIMAYTPEEAKKAIDLGYNFIALGSDMQALIYGLKTFIEKLENR